MIPSRNIRRADRRRAVQLTITLVGAILVGLALLTDASGEQPEPSPLPPAQPPPPVATASSQTGALPSNPFRLPAAVGQATGAPSDQLPPIQPLRPAMSAVPGSAVTPQAGVDSPQRPAEVPLGETRESIDSRLQQIQESRDLNEELKAELVKRYTKSLEWLKLADEAAEKTTAYELEIQQAPTSIAQLKQQLAGTLPEAAAIDAKLDLPQLEQQLVAAETQLSVAKEELAKREDELRRRTERSTQLSKLVVEGKRRLEEAQKADAPLAAGAASDPVVEAKRIENAARVQALERQLTLVQTENRRQEALAEVFPLQRDLARRSVTYHEKLVTTLQGVIADRRRRESERQAAEARRQVADALPALRDLARRNAVLADMRTRVARQIERGTADLKQIKTQTNSLKKEFTLVKEKVDRAGRSTTIGLVLRKKRDDLPNLAQCAEVKDRIDQQTPRTHLALLELEEERAALVDVDSLAAEIIDSLEETIQHYDQECVMPMVLDLLENKRDLLDRLIKDYDVHIKDLSELELANQELANQIAEISEFIDEHVLWIRSAEPLSMAELRASVNGVWALSKATQWLGAARQLAAETVGRPAQASVLGLLVAVLVLLRPRLRSRVRKLCDAASRQGQLRFWPTLEGMTLTLVLSSLCPLVLYYVAWRLESASTASDFCQAVAAGLILAATLLWVSSFVRQLTRDDGLGETHFQWPSPSLKMIRRHLLWSSLLGAVLIFVVCFSDHYDGGRWSNSLGRVTFVAGMLSFGALVHILFYPRGRLFQVIAVANPGSWLVRFRHVIYVLSAGSPLILAGLALVGYYYSAQQLARRIEATALVMLGLALLHAVASRWFLVKRRNLALRQARERAAESQAAGSSPPSTLPPQPNRNLSELHSQLHYLLRYAITISVLACGWVVWSDVMPALRVFDGVVIWNNKVQVTESVENAEGTVEVHTLDKEVPTTLRHAMIAILLICITYVLGSKLPALLEITVLDRLPIDHGGRHAISILVRYAVALTGVVLACRTMGIHWSSVQWLAAAMTVGLGFGLQEIFANLVSGLIILFERPIRIGDLVTVGTVTGRVSHMRMRATIVTDFDRRELIVPNKKFITDDVINWTLSDPISRVVIPVGIAYGSDTALAHSILLKVAQEHPMVLDDPPPDAMFKGFGDSTLDFDLRVFLPNRDLYPIVVHELNSAIDREFQTAGIEIAFPQRDINIRSLPPGLSMLAGIKAEKREAA